MYLIAAYDETNNPLTGLSPSFYAYLDRFGGSRAPPVLRNLGGGLYGFDPLPGDEAIGVGAIIDLGATAFPRYHATAIGNVAVFVFAYNDAGEPVTGASPVITRYVRPDGVTLMTPAVNSLGSGVYVFTPTDSDRLYGVAFTGTTTANPPRFSGLVGEAIITSNTPVAPAPLSTSTVPGNALPVVRDLAFDFKTGKFKISAGDLVLTQGVDAIRQAVQVMLGLYQGEWFLDTEAGIPYLQQILIKSPRLAAIRQILRSKIEAVPGILNVTRLDFNFDGAARTLSVSWSASSDLGEISGVVAPPLL